MSWASRHIKEPFKAAMAASTWASLGGEQRSLQSREMLAENRKKEFTACPSPPSTPAGAHWNSSVQATSHQPNILTLNAWLRRKRIEGSFGVHMSSTKKKVLLCTCTQQQSPTITTRANAELCQQMTQKRRRRRWKKKAKERQECWKKSKQKPAVKAAVFWGESAQLGNMLN